ncbi:hypothetical protein SVIOM74S_01839 [Streptomyces violarus]
MRVLPLQPGAEHDVDVGARLPRRERFAERVTQGEGEHAVGGELTPLDDEFAS